MAKKRPPAEARGGAEGRGRRARRPARRARGRAEGSAAAWKEEKTEGALSSPVKSGVGGLLLSSPSQTLRLTPLTSALCAARAHDAVLRMYPDLPLRFIKIHGDILVSYAYAYAYI